MGVELDADTALMVNVGVVVVLITLLLLATLGGGGGGKSVPRDAALLIGLPDVGKTALYQQLHWGRMGQTLTSMCENQCSVTNGGKAVPLIDVPGHPRLRESIREKYASRAKSVVFVIDAKDFKDTSRETAE